MADNQSNDNNGVVVPSPTSPTVSPDAPVDSPSSSDGSHIGTVSVRSLICLMLVVGLLGLTFMGKTINNDLINLTTMALGFLFGHTVGSKKM